MPTASAPRTLADQLRGWPDERLAALLRARPDLANPAPQDSAQVASRSAARASLLRALELLTLPELRLLELLVASPASTSSLESSSPLSPAATAAALERLADLALVWGSPERWRAMNQVADGFTGRPLPDLPLDAPPALATSSRDASLVDRAGAGAAFETCRRVALLLDTWGVHPPSVLRSGGLAVRDLKAASTLLEVPVAESGLLVELAALAGLLASTWHDGEEVWAPTHDADKWEALPVAAQWARLASAWLDSPRLVGLIGTKDRQGKTWNALSPELSGQWTAESRQMALAVLAELPPGSVLATGTGLPSLVARLEWLRPRRPATRAEQATWGVREAEMLGVAALGGLTSAGRALLSGADAAAALAPLLPAPVDHVLLQADLTAVAPGPLEAGLARRLHAVADVESRGGATVHRFTRESVRRALDAGWSAGDVHGFLAEVSRTPVPQALTFLVDDVARTHGTVRAGHAESFLRADDEAALSALVADPRASSLGLRRLAPTVVVSTTPLDVLLPAVRDLGLAPVVESLDGTVHVARADVVRAKAPRRRTSPSADLARRSASLAQVVRSIRVGDRASASRPTASSSERLTPAAAVTMLREAAQAGQSVWIGYVDNHGTTSERIVDPLSVEGGTLTAHDHRTEGPRTFTVHRITGVRPVTPP